MMRQLGHLLPDNIILLCRTDIAKTKRGVKYFCFACNRYVLKDKLHGYQTGYKFPAGMFGPQMNNFRRIECVRQPPVTSAK